MFTNSTAFLTEICNCRNLFSGKKHKISLIVVSHILLDKIEFINILNSYFDIEYIIPKPKSIDNFAYNSLSKKYRFWHISRNEIFENYSTVSNKLESIKNPLIIIDIGGYFAKVANKLKILLGDKLLGIIEDTENGFQKYIKEINGSFPFISVARSILKRSEDFLIGDSVVFSTDFILRTMNVLFRNKYAVVIGFGKIGNSIARQLHGKNIPVGIYDINPYKGIEAMTYGYQFLDRKQALKSADIIFCATGNFALQGSDFLDLKNNCIIASVTSSDDELDVGTLRLSYKRSVENNFIVRYSKDGKNIFLLNDGNAVNFVNNAVVGSFIYLVQAEIIHAIGSIISGNCNLGEDYTILDNEKQYIADIWLKYFNY